MLRRCHSISLAIVLFGCGPGRQAAWEKPPPAAAATAPTANDRADAAAAAWAQRGDKAQLENAIEILEEMTRLSPDATAQLTLLSRAYYLLADTFMRLAGQDDKMLLAFEKGVSTGERAMMAASPEFAARVQAGDKVEAAVELIPASGQEAIYWYAANLGKFAASKGFTTRLFYKDRILAVMRRVLSIDEKFFHAAPHRYFGAFYALAPAMAGGDLGKSKEHFERALALDANYFGTKVLYAEYYATKKGDKELFTRLLDEVKRADPAVLADLVPEQLFEQRKADRLLAQRDELF